MSNTNATIWAVAIVGDNGGWLPNPPTVSLFTSREKAEEFAAATAEEMGLPEKENDLWFDEEDAICVSLSEETIA